MTSNQWLFWLVLAIVSLILELSSGTFFILCVAIGAFCGMIAAIITLPFWAQVLVFAILSVASVYWVRPFILNNLHKEDHERLSNAEAIIGRVGTVTETIPAGGYGRVKVDGDEWKALSANGEEITVGKRTKILKLDSIIVTVEVSDNED